MLASLSSIAEEVRYWWVLIMPVILMPLSTLCLRAGRTLAKSAAFCMHTYQDGVLWWICGVNDDRLLGLVICNEVGVVVPLSHP